MQVEVGLRDAIRKGRRSAPTFFSFYAARFTFVRNVPCGRMGRHRPKDGAGGDKRGGTEPPDESVTGSPQGARWTEIGCSMG